LALRELAVKLLPQYEADEGALTQKQLNQIKKLAPKTKLTKIRSTLFDRENA
jgi:hypothetical protein